MEPDVMPLHSSPPPPIENGDVEEEPEEEGCGDCSPPGFAGSTDSPSSLRQPSPTIKPATHQHNCNSKHPMKRPQPSSTATLGSGSSQIIIEGRDYNQSCVHSTNGYAERRHNCVGVSARREETGFADFTVFTEQPEHPWCCGFTTLGSTGKWDGRDAGPNTSIRLGEQICDPEHEDITASGPRPPCTYEAKESVCTMVNHCDKSDAACVLPAQDNRQPQLNSSEKEVREDEESDGEDDKNSACTVNQTFSVYESASEDLVSFYEDLSFEGPSEDLEPNVSSLASEGQTDWDQTDDEEEELGIGGNCNSFASKSKGNLSQSKAENGFHYCHQSATQETSATSNQSLPETRAVDNFADFKGLSLEPDTDLRDAQTAYAGVRSLRTLPPSDSFADFCSATMQEDGGGLWAEFTDQQAQQGGRTGTLSGDQVSSLRSEGGSEERDWIGTVGASRRNSCQMSFSRRVQQLLLASFPEVEVPAAEWEEEALGHTAPQEMPEWIQRAVWWPHQDLHSAVALQFQWGGSHTNLTLLRCLGVDAKNTGTLEPTKNSVPAVGSPGHAGMTAPGLCDSDSMQEVLPSSPLDWSSRGLSSSQDGMSPRRAPSFWGRK